MLAWLGRKIADKAVIDELNLLRVKCELQKDALALAIEREDQYFAAIADIIHRCDVYDYDGDPLVSVAGFQFFSECLGKNYDGHEARAFIEHMNPDEMGADDDEEA